MRRKSDIVNLDEQHHNVNANLVIFEEIDAQRKVPSFGCHGCTTFAVCR